MRLFFFSFGTHASFAPGLLPPPILSIQVSAKKNAVKHWQCPIVFMSGIIAASVDTMSTAISSLAGVAGAMERTKHKTWISHLVLLNDKSISDALKVSKSTCSHLDYKSCPASPACHIFTHLPPTLMLHL